jgi:hypothetical protein
MNISIPLKDLVITKKTKRIGLLSGKDFQVEYNYEVYPNPITVTENDSRTFHMVFQKRKKNRKFDQTLFQEADYVMQNGIAIETAPNDAVCVSFGGLLCKFHSPSCLNTPYKSSDRWNVYIKIVA